ncbi:MAG: DUF1080 domain-containing protein [Phycisphaeraceae bacterium]
MNTCLFRIRLVLLAFVVAIAGPAVGADNSKAVYDDPQKAMEDADFLIQGEYAGESVGDETTKLGAQIIALSNGKFQGVGYTGGLPGDGWTKAGEKPMRSEGTLKDGEILFVGQEHNAVLKDGVITVSDKTTGKLFGKLKKITRESPTMGARPPKGAVILFDGKINDFKEGDKKVTKDGLLMQGITSKTTFTDFTLHAEFRIPFQPGARGQGRGNSGIYMQGRFETQMLDSFGLEGKNNECGGLYTIKDPDVNMCFPPLAWQTYDIDFTAARFDSEGKKTANAKITVKHNGVVVHQDVELPKKTTAAPVDEGPQPGPIYLQDHGNPVRYRNIWVLPKE